MPDGLWYARGPYNTAEGKPASAFSKGDLLMLDSSSSLSRIPEDFASGVDWVGVALADSVDSISDQVPYLIPEGDTDFWASLQSNLASHVTPGVERDLFFAVANNRYYVGSSNTTGRVAVVAGTSGHNSVDQSVQSKVVVRLIKHSGLAEY